MLLDILGSAGFGSIVGGIFGWLSKREERANMQMKFDYEINMVKAKTQAAIETAKLTIKQAETAGKLAVEKVEAQAFASSQKTNSFGEAVKSLIRPVILGLLMWQTYKILSALESLTGGLESMPEDEILALYRIVILSITGLTSTAVGWYFAQRTSKQFDRLIDKWKM